MVKREIASIKDMLNKSGEMFKNRPAYEVNNQVVTYNEFIEKVNALGTSLIDMGLKGKRIAIIGPNSFNWEMAYLAIVCGTGVVVPLDKSLPRNEMESLIKRSEINAIFFDEKYTKDIVEISQKDDNGLEILISMGEKDSNDDTFKNEFENSRFFSQNELIENGATLLKNGKRDFIDAKIDNEVVNILLFTSGTTSKSKAVMLCQRGIATNVWDLGISEYFSPDDTNIAFLPFHHIFGSTCLIFMLSRGVKTVFPDGLRYIKQNLNEYQVSAFVGVPLLIDKIYSNIEKEIEKQGKTKLINIVTKISNFLLKLHIDVRRKIFKQIIDQLGGKMRAVISGGAPLDGKVVRKFNEMGIHTVQGYGLTETSPVIFAENDYYKKAGSVGYPMRSVEARIVNKDENGIGEIAVKGPNVMLGYYEDEEATKKVLKDGWFYTGDLGYFDDEGFLFLTGRDKDVIVLKNGKKVFPEELETLVNRLDEVEECMVYGLARKEDKNDLKVCIKVVYNEQEVKEKYQDISEDDLYKIIWDKIKEINKTFPPYKYIKSMILTKEPLIKTTTQKVKRKAELERIISEN